MARMRPDPAYQKITADDFLAMDFGTDKRFELHDGVIVMMAGGTEPHNWVKGNIHLWLRAKLRGGACRPYDSDMAIRVSESDIRYPDVSIYCDQPPRSDLTGALTLANPTVLIEVLSPSTAAFDQGTKLAEYKLLDTVKTIAFVDPITEMCRTVERLETGWLEQIFSRTRGIEIPSLDITIPHADIFAPA